MHLLGMSVGEKAESGIVAATTHDSFNQRNYRFDGHFA
jgi:hypothetical protein